jgi:tetratricopeptide (TPR) repeat protein
LLIFEDTHWMDDASASLLRRLAAGLRERPWMLCTTRRDTGAGFAAGEDPEIFSLALEPISDEDAARLATADSEDEPLAPDAMAVLTRRAAGNPLFLRELVLAARRAGGVDALPETVEAVITSQVDALPAAERTRLRRLAVLGSRFEESVAEAVLGFPPLGGDVSASALERYLVREPEGTLRFAHALIRDAAYEGLPFRLRREIHARAGEVIEGRAPVPEQEAEILSLHFFASGEAERAWRYSVIAGDRARSLYANVEAAEFYGRALDSGRRIGVAADDRARVLTDLGEVRERLGRYDSASDAYGAARKLVAGRPTALATLYRREAWVREAAGRFSDAVRWHMRGLRLLEAAEGEDAQAARAAHMVGIASMRHAQGRARESIDWCQRAIAEAETVDDERVIAHACYLLDWLYEELGRPQDAPYPGRALAIYDAVDDLAGQSRVLNNLGMFAYFRGDWDEAAELYERGGRAAERMGDAVGGAYATANAAEIQLAQGHLEEAERRFREALRVWRAASYRQGVAFAFANLGTIAARTGRHEEADRLLGDARAEFQDVGSTGYAVEVDARMVEDAVLRGAADEALERITRILDAIERAGGMPTLSATVLRYRGYALAQLGDLTDAHEALERSLVLASEHDAAFEIALTLQALARVGELRGNDMKAIAAEAEQRFGTLGVVWTPSVPLAVAVT